MSLPEIVSRAQWRAARATAGQGEGRHPRAYVVRGGVPGAVSEECERGLVGLGSTSLCWTPPHWAARRGGGTQGARVGPWGACGK